MNLARKPRIVLILAAVLAVGAVSFYALAPSGQRIDYRMSTVEVGDIESVVLSAGTLAALNTVVVGSQLSGQVAELHADFNDTVDAGDLVARIDPRTFEARVQQNEADVAVAKGNIASRKADLQRAQATLRQAQRELERRQTLQERGHISATELDRDVTTVETSQAAVAVAEASIGNAMATLEQREASLAQSRLELERTYIRSPVSGTVINRQVELGQTVAASFSAPELFEIGQDLHQMKVEASVDEADIGRIREGMSCRFTVDAYPDRRFFGRIQQIRKAPSVVQNVVTYKVIITADNNDLALLPGMTASVQIVLGSKSDVVKVPNAALRFAPRGVVRETPSAGGQASGAAPSAFGGGGRGGGPGGGRGEGFGGGGQGQGFGGGGRGQGFGGGGRGEGVGGGGRGGFGGGGRGGGYIETVREHVDLTPEQDEKLEEVMESQRDSMRRAFQSGGGDREAMRARMQSMRAAMEREVQSILTPEQRETLQAAQAETAGYRRASVWLLGEDGEPEERRILAGLNDDESTEVVSGLEEGEDVIVRAVHLEH
ncbi:MAG: efflux RND transporter periplasmic adaptor subunit [Gammaproteobacteria bacterium]|nr:efflux RND transporter periplasmic adaptor subunit [Gammaproteobacteria bacterium]